MVHAEAFGQADAVVDHPHDELLTVVRQLDPHGVPLPSGRSGSSGNAWSTAFWSSSVSTTAIGVAMAASSVPASPSTVNAMWRSGDTTASSTIRTSGRRISMNCTSSPASLDRVSCTRAIEPIRRTDSAIASFASADSVRRAWSRRSDEIVCRLFFTR